MPMAIRTGYFNGTFYKQETIQLCPWLLELVISMGLYIL